MNCGDIQSLIALEALGGLEEVQSRALQEHLQRCRECRAAEADYHRLLGDLRRQAGPPVSNLPLIRRTLAAARVDLRAARRHGRRNFWYGTGALAAAVVLSVWLLSQTPMGWKKLGSFPAARPLRTLWTKQAVGSAPAHLGADMAVGTGKVFVLAEDGGGPQMAALDSRSGQTLWRGSDLSLGCLSADERRVYGLVRAPDGRVSIVALEQDQGQVLWRFSAGAPQAGNRYSRPQPLAEGRLCWSCGESVYAVDAAGGKEVWRQTLAGEPVLSEAVEAGRDLYVAGQKDLYCLDARTGAVKAKSTYECEICGFARPLLAVSGRRLFLATALRDGRSRVLCWDTRTNRCLWDKVAPRVSHLRAEGGNLYVRCQHVYALAQESGAVLWHYPASGCSPITLCQGLVCFVDGTDRGTWVALDRTSGVRQWQVPGLRSCTGVLVAGTTAYLKTTDSIVHAFLLGS